MCLKASVEFGVEVGLFEMIEHILERPPFGDPGFTDMVTEAEAIGHYERALAVKEQQQIDEEQAVLLFGLAQARLATWGRFQTQETREIVTILRRVFDFFAEVGDLDRAVTVAEHPVRTPLF